MHTKCRAEVYQAKASHPVARLQVADEVVPWDTVWEDYKPEDFTAQHVLTADWADPELGREDFDPQWNQVDNGVDRRSHPVPYAVVDGRPRNPLGRTGLGGRGVLGKWGPNHAADPIVTRWARTEEGDIVTDPDSGKQVLEFVAIQRKDTGAWAIPGGMVDPGEKVTATLKREFMEEALDSTGAAKEKITELQAMVDQFFSGGKEVYRGYVDDPRNTDNAWMETTAIHFHDDTGDQVGTFPLAAGDDAGAIQWMRLSEQVDLYASHKDFVQKVVENLGAAW